MSEEAKQAILDFMRKKKGKTKYYCQDLCKAVPNMKMRQVRKTINELVNEGKLTYRLSSDSTLYFRIDTAELDK